MAYDQQVEANEVAACLKSVSRRQKMVLKAEHVAAAVEAKGGVSSKAVHVIIQEEVK